jgi:hypothetical protein
VQTITASNGQTSCCITNDMTEDQGHQEVRDNTFGDHTFIHRGNVQGSVHVHNYPRAGRAEAVRVIPYPRNEDMVDRQDLAGRLNALLQPPQAARSCSAALWGLGGSGYVCSSQQPQPGPC